MSDVHCPPCLSLKLDFLWFNKGVGFFTSPVTSMTAWLAHGLIIKLALKGKESRMQVIPRPTSDAEDTGGLSVDRTAVAVLWCMTKEIPPWIRLVSSTELSSTRFQELGRREMSPGIQSMEKATILPVHHVHWVVCLVLKSWIRLHDQRINTNGFRLVPPLGNLMK